MKLEIRGLLLRLTQIILEVDITLQNARTALFGPSGAGKTSLLEAVIGLRQPERGEILLNGELFESTQQRYSLAVRRRAIGYVPQYDSLFPHLSVRRNLLYGLKPDSPDDVIPFEHVTGFLNIEPLLDRDVRRLSRGENQRVVIGRALLSRPRLLLLDEPLTGLDATLKGVILQQLESLYEEFGIPMLFVTHDPAEAIRLCDEVIKIESGKIIARGSPESLLSSTKGPRSDDQDGMAGEPITTHNPPT
jgi:molybdate transport system ATP-binding protein